MSDPILIKLKRSEYEANIRDHLLAFGEPAYSKDTDRFFVGDGVTEGGNRIGNLDVAPNYAIKSYTTTFTAIYGTTALIPSGTFDITLPTGVVGGSFRIVVTNTSGTVRLLSGGVRINNALSNVTLLNAVSVNQPVCYMVYYGYHSGNASWIVVQVKGNRWFNRTYENKDFTPEYKATPDAAILNGELVVVNADGYTLTAPNTPVLGDKFRIYNNGSYYIKVSGTATYTIEGVTTDSYSVGISTPYSYTTFIYDILETGLAAWTIHCNDDYGPKGEFGYSSTYIPENAELIFGDQTKTGTNYISMKYYNDLDYAYNNNPQMRFEVKFDYESWVHFIENNTNTVYMKFNDIVRSSPWVDPADTTAATLSVYDSIKITNSNDNMAFGTDTRSYLIKNVWDGYSIAEIEMLDTNGRVYISNPETELRLLWSTESGPPVVKFLNIDFTGTTPPGVSTALAFKFNATELLNLTSTTLAMFDNKKITLGHSAIAPIYDGALYSDGTDIYLEMNNAISPTNDFYIKTHNMTVSVYTSSLQDILVLDADKARVELGISKDLYVEDGFSWIPDTSEIRIGDYAAGYLYTDGTDFYITGSHDVSNKIYILGYDSTNMQMRAYAVVDVIADEFLLPRNNRIATLSEMIWGDVGEGYAYSDGTDFYITGSRVTPNNIYIQGWDPIAGSMSNYITVDGAVQQVIINKDITFLGDINGLPSGGNIFTFEAYGNIVAGDVVCLLGGSDGVVEKAQGYTDIPIYNTPSTSVKTTHVGANSTGYDRAIFSWNLSATGAAWNSWGVVDPVAKDISLSTAVATGATSIDVSYGAPTIFDIPISDQRMLQCFSYHNYSSHSSSTAFRLVKWSAASANPTFCTWGFLAYQVGCRGTAVDTTNRFIFFLGSYSDHFNAGYQSATAAYIYRYAVSELDTTLTSIDGEWMYGPVGGGLIVDSAAVSKIRNYVDPESAKFAAIVKYVGLSTFVHYTITLSSGSISVSNAEFNPSKLFYYGASPTSAVNVFGLSAAYYTSNSMIVAWGCNHGNIGTYINICTYVGAQYDFASAVKVSDEVSISTSIGIDTANDQLIVTYTVLTGETFVRKFTTYAGVLAANGAEYRISYGKDTNCSITYCDDDSVTSDYSYITAHIKNNYPVANVLLYADVTSGLGGYGDPDNWIGIANTAAASGSDVDVIIPGGTAAHYTGLTPGDFYYVDDDGFVVAGPGTDARRIGRALTSTTIQVVPYPTA
jgi:hypothetical protein